MNRNQGTSDQLDRLLDGALAAYSEAEPRAGIELRIIATLRTASVEPSPFLGWPTLAGQVFAGSTVAALLIAGAITWTTSQKQAPISQALPPTVAQDSSLPNSPITTHPAPSIKVRQRQLPTVRRTSTQSDAAIGQVGVVADVRHSEFPAPSALNDQEKLALQFADLSRKAPVSNAVTHQPDPVAEIAVPTLKIEPLELKEMSEPTK